MNLHFKCSKIYLSHVLILYKQYELNNLIFLFWHTRVKNKFMKKQHYMLLIDEKN